MGDPRRANPDRSIRIPGRNPLDALVTVTIVMP